MIAAVLILSPLIALVVVFDFYLLFEILSTPDGRWIVLIGAAIAGVALWWILRLADRARVQRAGRVVALEGIALTAFAADGLAAVYEQEQRIPASGMGLFGLGLMVTTGAALLATGLIGAVVGVVLARR